MASRSPMTIRSRRSLPNAAPNSNAVPGSPWRINTRPASTCSRRKRVAISTSRAQSNSRNSGSRRSKVLKLLPSYLQIVDRLATEFGAIHVRTHDAFQRQLQYRPADTFCPEPVHPNLAGHTVIAHTLLRAIGW